jgi:DNA segregation ATPase FtsK/SpoIIIE, S-DNA-T family
MSIALHGERLDEPELPSGQLVLEAPPRIEPRDAAGGVVMNAIPLLGTLGSIVLIAGLGRASGGRGYLAAGLLLLGTLGFFVAQVDRQRRQRLQQVTRSRAAYLRYLAGVRTVVREAAARQRRALTWQHPDPAALPPLAAERSRVWARAPSDAAFLHVRYGVGAQPLSLELVPAESAPFVQVDPAAGAALHRFLVVHRRQPDLPATIDLRAFARVEICGSVDPARALARSLICSAVTFHSPEHLLVAVLASERNLARWDWVKWLPHALSARRSDAVGPLRMVSTSVTGLADLLPADLADRPRVGAGEAAAIPHVLLVTDGADKPDLRHGVTLLDLPARWDELDDPTTLRLRLEGESAADRRPPVLAMRAREEPVSARADQCTPITAEALARRLTPLRPGDSGSGEPRGPSDFPGLLGVGDLRTLDPPTAWRRPRSARDRLRVPVGHTEDGAVVHLDLKESAQQGMGPHGLVIGATGSGKSEFLRTLVLGLALTHPPEQLNLVLVDFKGGATFAGLSGLPHVSALITNLAQELPLVDRMQDALAGELVRRQELLRRAGNVASARDYEAARAGGEDLAPLPTLLVVVDEFSELLAARPAFVDLFVAIGRLGRSLGLHLLLASQRLEEGRLRGLESHLSYRVGLRTFSATESRSVLGVPDAYELPAVPGLGYLKSGPSTMLRFRAAYVSGPPPGSPRARRPEDPHEILPFQISEVHLPAADGAEPAAATPADEQESLLDLAVRRLATHGPVAHQVWLPPLDRPDTLDGLVGELTHDAHLGLTSPRWRGLGGLVVPLGTVDRPREQRRDPLTANLGGASGHVAVVGGPRCGKSTLLRTIVASLSLTSTPRETQFFVLDFGGGTFAPLARLPHVAGVGTRAEPDVVRRILAEVRGVVDRREAGFPAQGIDSIETYRSRRAAGLVDDGYGDVFLVVDGWSTLRADFDDLEVELHKLATRGLTFGLHVVAATPRWADFRSAVRDVFGTRLELRLGDPVDSEVDRRVAALVPPDRPGRGLVPGPLHFLAALPRIDGVRRADTLAEGIEDLVARVAAGWTGPSGPRLRLLPRRIDLDTVRAQAATCGAGDRLLLLGVDEKELAPIGLDPDAEPHLVIFGDGRSGKSTVLRGYLREIIRTRTPEQAQVVVVDYRRSLLGEVPREHLFGYLTSATQAQPAITDLADRLGSRLPGPDVPPKQLRDRSWWTGAEIFVVIDDYDLVATQHASPLLALQPLLAQASDTGLHVVVARRSGGASRAMYEPLLQAMRDLGAPGLLLSGSPDEGALVGNQRPAPAPPGRGRLVSGHRGVEILQTAWTEPRW